MECDFTNRKIVGTRGVSAFVLQDRRVPWGLWTALIMLITDAWVGEEMHCRHREARISLRRSETRSRWSATFSVRGRWDGYTRGIPWPGNQLPCRRTGLSAKQLKFALKKTNLVCVKSIIILTRLAPIRSSHQLPIGATLVKVGAELVEL